MLISSTRRLTPPKAIGEPVGEGMEVLVESGGWLDDDDNVGVGLGSVEVDEILHLL